MLKSNKKWQYKINLYRNISSLSLNDLIKSTSVETEESNSWFSGETIESLNRDLFPRKGWNFINYNLRGIGQVVFINNPISGLIILMALFIQSPWVGWMSLLGVVTSTFTAIALDLDRGNIRNGIYGYNGVLVGAAIANFGLGSNGSQNFDWTAATVLFSAMTTVLLQIAGNWSAKIFKSPPLTLPFNLMTLLFLCLIKFVSKFDLANPEIQSNLVNGVDPTKLVSAIFIGFGQIFLADKFIVGVLVLGAIAFCTPIGAMVGFAGSVIGLITGLLLGAPIADIYSGLYCYNSILGAMAIGGIFYVFNQRSFWLALGCGCLSVFMMQICALFLGIFGLPMLTLPFCIATILLFIVLKQLSPFLVPVSLHAITNPEEHRQRYLDARKAICYFRFQLERFMLDQPSNFWFNLANNKEKTNLRYIFNAIDIEHKNEISVSQAQLYLRKIDRFPSRENLTYLLKFIDPDNIGVLSYDRFSELILRHEYLITKHQLLTDYFLPLDKHQNDPITVSEINRVISSTNHVPLTTMQLKSLQTRIGTNSWTWSQFVKVILST